ncbi:MAG: 3'-5' exonuclease [Myxococcota bacterium]
MPLDLAHLLNPPQLEAATWPSGPICIVAGAGSGKTRVITHRLAHLVERGLARPEELLAVTFTNKAAKELRERVDALLPGVGSRLWVTTFHSAAARILREAHGLVKLPRSFVIYDQDDAERLINQICQEMNIARDQWSAVAHKIEQLEHQATLPDEFNPEQFDVPGRNAKKVYKTYLERLEAAGAVDFGGLIVKALKVVRDAPTASFSVARLTHAVVDEYQDVNLAQARMVEALAPRLKSMAVVGDDDQSIYRWRGASAHSLLTFTRTFQQAHQVQLRENYRSTSRILRLANEVIRRNTGRLGKDLWTQAPEGHVIRLRCLEGDREEAASVVQDCMSYLAGGKSASEVAILYRTNAQSRVFEEALHRSQLKYRIIGGLRFYERREVKDVLAYLRLVVNPTSEIDLRRIINVPARSIGDTTLKQLDHAAALLKKSLWDTLHEPQEELVRAGVKNAGAAKLKEFTRLMDELRSKAQNLAPTLAITEIMALTAYDAFLRAEEDGEERLQNLGSLANAAADYEEDAPAAGETPTVEGFLERTSLQTDQDQADDDKEAITLMTLHAAKGLEFDRVHLVGVEEGLLPSSRALNSPDSEDIQEERRLCYVGLTRARTQLCVSFCRRRMWQGQIKYAEPSRFLRELPEETIRNHLVGDIDHILPRPTPAFSRPGAFFDPAPTSTRKVERGGTTVVYDDDMPSYSRRETVRRPMRMEPPVLDLDLEESDVMGRHAAPAPFPRGQRVTHPQFGAGTVLDTSGSGPMARVEVDFGDRLGVRRVIARYLTRAEAGS